MAIWYPDRDDVEIVARQLAAKWFQTTDTSPPSFFGMIKGPEGEAALQSALGIIQQPYYRQVHHKAGALLRSLIKNHAFVDGNKRIAVITTINFLTMNDHLFFATDQELVDKALEIAKSEPDTPWRDVAVWIEHRCFCAKSRSEHVHRRLREHSAEARARLTQIRTAWTEFLDEAGPDFA